MTDTYTLESCSVCGELASPHIYHACGGTPTYREPQSTLVGWTCSVCGAFVTGSAHMCRAPGHGVATAPSKALHKCPAGWTYTLPESLLLPDKVPHKCPVCAGTGLVSRPPGVAGDQEEWTDSGAGPYGCRACGGTGLLWEAP